MFLRLFFVILTLLATVSTLVLTTVTTIILTTVSTAAFASDSETVSEQRDATTISYELRGEAIQYLDDPLHTMGIEDLLKFDRSAWIDNEQSIPSFGFSLSTYWFRIQIDPLDQEHLLELDYGLLDEVTLYRVVNGKVVDTVKSGDKLSFSNRPIQHRAFLFPIPSSDNPQEVILQVRSSSSIQLPLALWPSIKYFEDDQYRFAEHGIYYGLVLVIALYNLFLFIRLRDSAYAFYVLYLVTFALAQLSLTGFAYQFIWPEAPDWNEKSLAVITPLIVTAGMVFVSNFLKLKEYYPLLNRVVYGLAWIGILIAALSTMLPYSTMIPYGADLAILACVSILAISYFITFKTAHRSAVYFSAAWSVFLIGTVVLALNKFGFIPRTFLTESAAQIGSAIEIILLSFALAERLHYATTRRFKAEAETLKVSEQLIETQRQQNEALEKEVQERTQALQSALESVQKLNSELEDLSTMDQVTGIRNRRYFDEMMDREHRRGVRNQRLLSLVMIDLDRFKLINDNYGHLAGDQVLKSVSSEVYRLVKRPPDLVCRYGGEELAVVLPETDADGAAMIAERIRSHIEALWVETDEGRLQVTASLGVSTMMPSPLNTTQDLIEQADQALYRAKENGRNQFQAFNS